MKNTKKLISIIFILALSIPLILSSSVNAANYYGTYYGYKAGDEYAFQTTMTMKADTPSGKASTSASSNFNLTIVDVVEDSNGHSIDIQYMMVESFGDPIVQSHMEGNVTSFTTGSQFSPIASIFVTTDWDNRSREWFEYVDSEYVGQPGCFVQSLTHTNGEFSVAVNLDLDSTHSDIDFNGDGIHDAYTGTILQTIKYDSNGVLQSASMTQTVTSPDKGTMTTTIQTESATLTTDATSTTVTIIIIFSSTIAIIALALGISLFSNKRKMNAESLQMKPIQTP